MTSFSIRSSFIGLTGTAFASACVSRQRKSASGSALFYAPVRLTILSAGKGGLKVGEWVQESVVESGYKVSVSQCLRPPQKSAMQRGSSLPRNIVVYRPGIQWFPFLIHYVLCPIKMPVVRLRLSPPPPPPRCSAPGFQADTLYLGCLGPISPMRRPMRPQRAQ